MKKLLFITLILACLASQAQAALPGLMVGRDSNVAIVAGTFVKIGDGNLATSSAASDQSIGVCVSDSNHVVVYAPAGMVATVRIPVSVANGALLVCDANGWAVAASADANVAQQIVAQAVATGTVVDPNIGGTVSAYILPATRSNRGLIPAVGLNIVDPNNTPGAAFVFEANMPAAGTTITYTIPVGKRLRVFNVSGSKNLVCADGNNTVTVYNATNPISNAISLAVADKAVLTAGTLDYAYQDIAGGGTLKITTVSTGGNTAGCRVNVLCAWVAP